MNVNSVLVLGLLLISQAIAPMNQRNDYQELGGLRHPTCCDVLQECGSLTVVFCACCALWSANSVAAQNQIKSHRSNASMALVKAPFLMDNGSDYLFCDQTKKRH